MTPHRAPAQPKPTFSRSLFYNPHRRHSAIGYHSPTDYERRAITTPTTLPIP